MRNQLTPIIIGFPLDEQVNRVIIRVNHALGSSEIDFNSRIPHVTLWMGFVKTKQIDSLNLGLNKIFQNVSMEVGLKELELFKSQFGLVWSLELELTRSLYLLQNRVHHFFEPFREISDKFNGLSDVTVNYINDFSSKSLDNYSPHITIGMGQKEIDLELDKTIILKDPKMFEMGDFCTCVQLIQ